MINVRESKYYAALKFKKEQNMFLPVRQEVLKDKIKFQRKKHLYLIWFTRK
jgi:hypothetical protein